MYALAIAQADVRSKSSSNRHRECRFFNVIFPVIVPFQRRMNQVHEFAFFFYSSVCQPAPELARLGTPDAPALKATL